MRLRTVAAGILLAALALAFAQAATAAPLPGCNDPRAVARFLRLTPAQIEDVRDLRTALRTAVEPLRAQVQPLREQLGDLLEAANPVACTVGDLVVRIDGLTDRIHALQEDFEDDFEALLTPEQLVKWRALQVVCRAKGQTPGA
jgi:Spy/CpxP family protein refolding chaperone